MARQAHDREDLLAEAKALLRRAEIAWNDSPKHLVIGFRANGCASVYFSADCALHFDTRQRLRRAYLDDQLLVADAGQLAALRRQRTAAEVQLLRRPLSAGETHALLNEARDRLMSLRAELAAGRAQCTRAVWEGGNVAGDIIDWIDRLPNPLAVSDGPHAR